uniref:IgGFc_binding domain-containing protein n=1 Tax=Rhabditophanes sp. KR3021 TaxID=114890 RepID=A0AC35UAN8_9BILA
MPTSDSSYKGTVGILPVHKEGSIMVNIVEYANGALLSNETIQYESTFGQNQHYIAINLYENIDNKFTEDINASISITTSSPVMLIFEAPETTSSNVYGDDSCGTECYSDFVQFMSVATQPLQCGSVLISADERMITNDFTTRLHVSSPNLGSYCDVPSLITVYDNTNNIEGTEQVVDKMGFTKIALDNISFAGFSTNAGEMATNRFGSIFGMDGVTAYGHFMNYIPSTKE